MRRAFLFAYGLAAAFAAASPGHTTTTTTTFTTPDAGAGQQRPLRLADGAAGPLSPQGTLHRVRLAGEGDPERAAQLGLLAAHDVWHVTPTYADVFVPASSPAELPLPPTSSRAISFAPSSAAAASSSTLAQDEGEGEDDDAWLGHLNSSMHAAYRSEAAIHPFIANLTARHPGVGAHLRVGASVEGRPISAVRIGRDDGQRRPALVVFGPQHGRDWIGVSTATYLTHALLVNETEPGSLRPLLDDFDFYIFPITNPDGYAYTWTDDRLWYKNRQPLDWNRKCIGIDMNRNWGFKWSRKTGGGGPTLQTHNNTTSTTADDEDDVSAMQNPCVPWYPGSRAFEAPETNALAAFVQLVPRVAAFVELRAYGQMLSTPYAYSCKRWPKDAENQHELGLGLAHAMQRVFGTSFSVGTLCGQLYRAHGNAVDWMYARAGIKYSYALHLRDTGTYGFALPPEWIRPVGQETASMIQYLAKFLKGKV